MKKKLFPHWPLVIAGLFWLCLDLASKLTVKSLAVKNVVIIPHFFSLNYHINRGVALGINLGYFFQMIVSAGILGLILYLSFRYWLKPKRNRFLNQCLLGIIVGGAVGNLVNRIQWGYVVDFIVLKPFPIFNLADVGITVGLILFFIINWRKE